MHSVRHLELVRALAEHRNFGRAAAALGVSQPSLTRSLKQLEDRLGAPLFDRSGVTPTIIGEIVLRRGRAMLVDFAELHREIAMTKGLEIGELTVALAFFPADISGHEAAARLSRRHPRLALVLRMVDWSKAYEMVLSGEADIGFGDIRPASDNPDFVAERVRAGPVTFFCASDHPLAGRDAIRLDDLVKYPWTGPSFAPAMGAGMPRDELPCGAFHRETGRFHPRIMVESFASAKQIVLAGAALSAGFPFQIERELASGDLVLMPAQLPLLTLDYGFIVKRGRALSPAATAFMEVAREIERGKGERVRGARLHAKAAQAR